MAGRFDSGRIISLVAFSGTASSSSRPPASRPPSDGSDAARLFHRYVGRHTGGCRSCCGRRTEEMMTNLVVSAGPVISLAPGLCVLQGWAMPSSLRVRHQRDEHAGRLDSGCIVSLVAFSRHRGCVSPPVLSPQQHTSASQDTRQSGMARGGGQYTDRRIERTQRGRVR